MFLKKATYWGAGLSCGILVFIIVQFVNLDYSFYTKRHNSYDFTAKYNLHNIYLGCKVYWAETKPTNACNIEIVSLTTYGYIQSADVVIWGDGGTASDFSLKGKSRLSKKVYKLENKMTIREIGRERVGVVLS